MKASKVLELVEYVRNNNNSLSKDEHEALDEMIYFYKIMQEVGARR